MFLFLFFVFIASLRSQENKRLSEPLTVALTDVAELHAYLRGQEKDRMSLANAKARLRVIDEQVSAMHVHRRVEGDGSGWGEGGGRGKGVGWSRGDNTHTNHAIDTHTHMCQQKTR